MAKTAKRQWPASFALVRRAPWAQVEGEHCGACAESIVCEFVVDRGAPCNQFEAMPASAGLYSVLPEMVLKGAESMRRSIEAAGGIQSGRTLAIMTGAGTMPRGGKPRRAGRDISSHMGRIADSADTYKRESKSLGWTSIKEMVQEQEAKAQKRMTAMGKMFARLEKALGMD